MTASSKTCWGPNNDWNYTFVWNCVEFMLLEVGYAEITLNSGLIG